ncbi:hypothetical protein QUR79_07575 [Arcobacter cryaerophilus gv. pseudocryaerophilus]|uniref:Prepilin-type N-terminal cleavage/methylation domain-containing protein n=1 Tax=Arcobacter cryaerophilus gv. pseudocryaerophilus TaxID=2933791 RepID=A0AAU0P076_9BACT|nr:hypothetical protein QUR79_07575 [Arcobacter sp. DSM 115972]
MQIKLLDFKKKAFSTLEIVIFIVIISIVLSFAIPKFRVLLDKSDLSKLKSDIALINNGIQKEKSKNILIQKYGDINKLDDANIDSEKEKLFEYILDFPFISTSKNESKNGYWAKVSVDKYIFFTRKNQYEFLLKDGQFLCVSSLELCEELF